MMQHVTALKCVLRYLHVSGMRTYAITYNDILDHPNHFYSYSDATFANADDQKSTSRYVFMMARGAITWFSKKQSITALSSMEAEYIALSKAACVTAGSLTHREPSMDGVVTRVGKGDGAAEGFREAQP
jgi:hypothetical protein